MARQSRQRAASKGPDQRAGFSRLEFCTIRHGAVRHESHHARAMPVHQPQASRMLGHTTDRDKGGGDGDGQFPECDGAVYCSAPAFFKLLRDLASDADAAKRGGIDLALGIRRPGRAETSASAAQLLPASTLVARPRARAGRGHGCSDAPSGPGEGSSWRDGSNTIDV